MESQGSDDIRQDSSRTSSVRHQTRATYDTLIRQSKKLGEKATRTMGGASQNAKQILGQKPVEASSGVNNIDELKKVIEHSHEVIVSTKTVVPFIFRDEIVLDRAKITIVKRTFVRTSDMIAIRIEDVLNIAASVGPIFGSIRVSSRVFNSVDHYDVGSFWRDDALRMKKIMQGYMLARQNGVQTDHLSCEELAKTLLEIEPDNH